MRDNVFKNENGKIYGNVNGRIEYLGMVENVCVTIDTIKNKHPVNILGKRGVGYKTTVTDIKQGSLTITEKSNILRNLKETSTIKDIIIEIESSEIKNLFGCRLNLQIDDFEEQEFTFEKYE